MRRLRRQLGTVNFQDANQKQTFNRDLFGVVAPAYRKVTKFMSLGQDGRWKRKLVERVGVSGPKVCLDLACGTGDICRLLRKRHEAATIVGIDQSEEMLQAGRSQMGDGTNISLKLADMDRLPLESGSVDVVTGGYAIRNAPDLTRALLEIARVLKPGGSVAILDFSKSENSFAASLQHFFLHWWGSLWGWLFHRDPEVYGYIAKSLESFPDRGALLKRFEHLNLHSLYRRRFLLGFVELMVFEKRID